MSEPTPVSGDKPPEHIIRGVRDAMSGLDYVDDEMVMALAQVMHDELAMEAARALVGKPALPWHVNDVHLRYFPDAQIWVCWIDSPTFWAGASSRCELARGEHPTDPWKAMQAAIDAINEDAA